MVYEIYDDYGSRPRKILFDIEYYLKCANKEKNVDYKVAKDWFVELHASSFISGAVDFLSEKFKDKSFNVEEFKNDCYELEELRGWIWEQHRNPIRTVDEAEADQDEWGKYVEEKIYGFAKKYGLSVNVD